MFALERSRPLGCYPGPEVPKLHWMADVINGLEWIDLGEITMRCIATVLLAIVLFGVADSKDCEAQLFRGRINRFAQRKIRPVNPPIFVKPAGHVGLYVPQAASAHRQPTRFSTESYFENRSPLISRILDGKMTHKYRDPNEVDSRYIGGFHQSYFQNIGIPSGDIGIRGNAYNWRTW